MTKAERPRIDLPATGLDKALDAFSLAGVMLIVALMVAVWDKLPARVPTHFGMSGPPDGWGARSSLLLFVIAPLVIHIVLTILARFPWIYNYPTKVTLENAERLYRLGAVAGRWLRTEMVWLFVILGWQTVRVALGQATGLPASGAFIGLGIMYATVIYLKVLMFRRR